MPRLSRDQIRPYLSPYLMSGWREDELTLDSVVVESGRIEGHVSANSYFLSGDGAFHLTVPMAFIWVAQFAIIYGCWEQRLAAKPGEVYVREIQLKCKRPVRTPSDIEFSLALQSQKVVSEGMFYSGTIVVDRGAFAGKGRFVLPLPRT